jgi:hypothetical protein
MEDLHEVLKNDESQLLGDQLERFVTVTHCEEVALKDKVFFET